MQTPGQSKRPEQPSLESSVELIRLVTDFVRKRHEATLALGARARAVYDAPIPTRAERGLRSGRDALSDVIRNRAHLPTWTDAHSGAHAARGAVGVVPALALCDARGFASAVAAGGAHGADASVPELAIGVIEATCDGWIDPAALRG